MAGYRRLISYIYAYEGEEKREKHWFHLKLEARNRQCRLSINVKKIYAGAMIWEYICCLLVRRSFRKYFYPQWQRGFQDLR